MRLALAAGAAALLFAQPSLVGADAKRPVPSLEELRQKSTKELKAILKSKGKKCKKCIEKDDYVHRVADTWHSVPKEAKSPDGKIQLTKEMFIAQLKQSYGQHQSEKTSDQGASGHQLEGEEGGGQNMPNFDEVWADFADKLQLGEIQKDESGNLMYEVGDYSSGWSGLWERYKMHLMIALNLGLLWFSQRVRKTKRDSDRAKLNEGLPGPKIMELDEDDVNVVPGGSDEPPDEPGDETKED